MGPPWLYWHIRRIIVNRWYNISKITSDDGGARPVTLPSWVGEILVSWFFGSCFRLKTQMSKFKKGILENHFWKSNGYVDIQVQDWASGTAFFPMLSEVSRVDPQDLMNFLSKTEGESQYQHQNMSHNTCNIESNTTITSQTSKKTSSKTWRNHWCGRHTIT